MKNAHMSEIIYIHSRRGAARRILTAQNDARELIKSLVYMSQMGDNEAIFSGVASRSFAGKMIEFNIERRKGLVPMQQLKERIVREGKVLPGNIIKVDGFLNHRVDTGLMGDIADEFAKYFDTGRITLVLTAEASGIALATVCAQRYGVPMVFAKKAKSDNIEGGLFHSEIFSYTYKKKITQLVSREWLCAEDRVLIVDDFLANGEALRGLCEIVEQAGAELVGIGVAIEKGFQKGGHTLRQNGYNLKSLAIIERADENGVEFREDEE